MARYFAKKVEIDGIIFDSEMESIYYLLLKERIEKGEVSHLMIHRPYLLLPGFKYNKTKIKQITYEADFVYFDHTDGNFYIEDVKGFSDGEFKLKWKMLKYEVLKSFLSTNTSVDEYTSYINSVDVIKFINNQKKLPIFRVIKYSKTTGFVEYKDYKKAMASAKKRAIMEKNEAIKEKDQMKKDLKTIKTLKAKKTPLTKLQAKNLSLLTEQYKEFI